MPGAHHKTWKVLEHRPIQKLTPNLWCIDGALPDMPVRRTGTIVRRCDGALVFHNPMPLDEAAMRDVEAWGELAFLLVPNAWHRLDIGPFRARYPKARLLCPAGAVAKVAQVVPVDGTFAAYPVDDATSLEHLDGVGEGEGVLTVRGDDGVTLVFNDIVFNQPHLPGLFGAVYRLIGSSGGPRVPWVLKKLLVKDRARLRAHLERLADTPDLARVVVMHGTSVDECPGDFLRAVAATLAP
jgi:hypothetical protein